MFIGVGVKGSSVMAFSFGFIPVGSRNKHYFNFNLRTLSTGTAEPCSVVNPFYRSVITNTNNVTELARGFAEA